MLYSLYMKKYFYHKIENLLLVNKIVTLHRFSFDKDFASAGESHNFWEIVFAERESLVCKADGREIILEFYRFLRPEQKFDSLEALKHQIRADAEETRRYFAGV